MTGRGTPSGDLVWLFGALFATMWFVGCASPCADLQAVCDQCRDPNQRAACERSVDEDPDDVCEQNIDDYSDICN